MEEKITKYRSFIEIGLGLMIFLLLYFKGKVLEEFSFFGILAAFLSFIILVEVIRMVGHYLITNHISVTLMIDMVIIFFCRDILLIAADKKLLFEDKFIYISFFIFVVFAFIKFRTLTRQQTILKEELDNNRKEKK